MEKVKYVLDSSKTVTDTAAVPKYTVDNGFLCYKKRVVLSPTSPWRHKIIEEYHSTPGGGHQGVVKTYHRIKKGFYWQGMKTDIRNFVVECNICQQNKVETIAPPGLLQPLPIPQKNWSDISMDFIVGLPNCKSKTVIMVVVDRLSKYAHFIALSHPYTAVSVAQAFIESVFKLHGMPSSIVSDRDPVFISAFWREFFKLQGSKLCMSSGYHPQSDGQTEVMNRCLETYLRCFIGGQPKKWVNWLPWAEWCFNTSHHTSAGFTPFELVYGHAPPHIAPYEVGTAKMDSVEQSLLERDSMLAVLKHNLEVAQNRMKVQSDKRRTERHFNVGDKVYLKLVPYQLQTLAAHSYHKLQPRFFGPYEVLEKIGMVAYKLKLPEGSKIHLVFHVSCLKKQLGEGVVSHVNLPIAADDGLMQNLPQAILARRMYKKGSAAGVQLLVQWNGQEAAEASWEDFDAFKNRYPDFPV